MSNTELEAAIAEFCEAFARHDVDAVVSFYADDGRLLSPGSPIIEGRAEIAKFFQSVFDTRPTALEMDVIESIETGDYIIKLGRHRIYRAESGTEPAETGKALVVYQRQPDGQLKMIVDAFSDSPPE
jgi:uncharacterized protein (TIGR02246 family)